MDVFDVSAGPKTKGMGMSMRYERRGNEIESGERR